MSTLARFHWYRGGGSWIPRNVSRVHTGLIPSSQRTWTDDAVAGKLLRQGAGPLQQGREPEQHGRGGVPHENEGPVEDCRE